MWCSTNKSTVCRACTSAMAIVLNLRRSLCVKFDWTIYLMLDVNVYVCVCPSVCRICRVCEHYLVSKLCLNISIDVCKCTFLLQKLQKFCKICKKFQVQMASVPETVKFTLNLQQKYTVHHANYTYIHDASDPRGS